MYPNWVFMFKILSPHQGSPLHWAARGGHVDTVIFFLEQGIDVNIKNENRVSKWNYSAEWKFCCADLKFD